MKKIAAILLLGMLVFNWCGYRFFVSYLEDKSDAKLEAQLDRNEYDASQLISIKIPATHYSYYTNSKTFERVDGKIEIKGVTYKYVASRLFNDSLELLCIPDFNTMKFSTAKNDFFQLVTDLQHNGKKANSLPTTSKMFQADFFTANDLSLIHDLSFSQLKRVSTYQSHLLSPCICLRGQPPKIS